MASVLNPYISFKDNARKALEFYQSALGGELSVNTFASFGTEGPEGEKIMHGSLETPAGFTLMASDTPEDMEYKPGASITICLSGEDAAEMRGYWEKLSDGATVAMPLEKQVWGDEFGQLFDKFGVGWMVNINQPQA